jgi:hypothetical protein
VQTPVIPMIASAMLEAALLAALPPLLIAIGSRAINAIEDAHLPWTPYVELGALATGAAAGAIIFGHSVDPSTLGPSAVFQVGGPWDMPFGEFIARVANPFRYDFSVLLSSTGLLIVLIAALFAAAPMVWFRGSAAVANGVRNAFLAVAGAYSAIYGLGYCLWLLNRLNFWVFLLLMVLVHLHSRTDKVVFKLH